MDKLEKEAAMTPIPDGVRIFHIRNRYGPWPGETLNRGGITVATKIYDDKLFGAIGVCGFKRSFNKKLGVKVAVGRLLLLLDGDYPLFARTFDLDRFGIDSDEEQAMCVAHILVEESRLRGRQKKTAKEALESTRVHGVMMAEVEDDRRRRLEARKALVNIFPDESMQFNIEGTRTGRVDCSRPNEAHPGGTTEESDDEERSE